MNVHFASKGGSSSLHGDARPPVNGGVDIRQAQAEITAVSSVLLSLLRPIMPFICHYFLHPQDLPCLQNFIASILEQDSDARVIASGDFNEFAFVAPLESFVEISGLRNADVLAGLRPEERYTYLFDMNSQQLDHSFVSRQVRNVELEHLHINTWVTDGASDHDPTVLKVGVCPR